MDDIVERLECEIDLCIHDGAVDIANLLGEAVLEIRRLSRELERLNARTLARPWGD